MSFAQIVFLAALTMLGAGWTLVTVKDRRKLGWVMIVASVVTMIACVPSLINEHTKNASLSTSVTTNGGGTGGSAPAAGGGGGAGAPGGAGGTYNDNRTINNFTQPKLESPTFHELPGPPIVEFGSGVFGNNITPMRIGDYIPFNVKVQNDTLLLDVKLWSPSGESPVEITNNEFLVKPPRWDKNSSQNALEVVNEQQQPILQFVKKNPSHYSINGIFPTPKGVLFASDNGFTLIPFGFSAPPNFKLTPIFKYLSWKYPGKYADGSN
jgi:hypothetical protein